ncbi:MAG: S41 family peptidase [Bacteroidetes bacterium]|nr:MAG: S41 family peptidase [Bacteroidota bacterium]
MRKKMLKIVAVLLIFVSGMATTVLTETNRHFEILKNIEIFANVYREVNTNYVDEIDPGQFMRTGIDAMVGSLDPFTNYISESDIESYRFMTEGKYHGIGAVSAIHGDYVTITSIYKDQPADKAGLKVGDQIVAVDGASAKGKTMDEFNLIIKGYPGTSVDLTVKRPGESKNINITLVRGEVDVQNVPFHGMVTENVGYIALTVFTKDAGRNIKNAFKELKENNPDLDGLILDLRGNGGGLLREAVSICNIFIPKDELVVSTRGKVKDWDRSFKTMGEPFDLEIPLTVLINKNSASASEIVSGVMQDYDRGVLIGQRSYGKGLVQNTMDVGYNSKVKITTAKYYIPSQRCIQSVEYKDGEPVEIADDLRAKFTTRNGRTVLDGGGVKPDVLIDAPNKGVMKGLTEENLIFDFVTEYCLNIDSIKSIENYHFNDFNSFVNFLEDRDYKFEMDSEKLLKQLSKKAQEDGFALNGELSALENKMRGSKRQEVLKHEEEIVAMIEKEIATRFHYQEGQIRMGLRNDKEIKEAISLLNDRERYNKVLGK